MLIVKRINEMIKFSKSFATPKIINIFWPCKSAKTIFFSIIFLTLAYLNIFCKPKCLKNYRFYPRSISTSRLYVLMQNSWFSSPLGSAKQWTHTANPFSFQMANGQKVCKPSRYPISYTQKKTHHLSETKATSN